MGATKPSVYYFFCKVLALFLRSFFSPEISRMFDTCKYMSGGESGVFLYGTGERTHSMHTIERDGERKSMKLMLSPSAYPCSSSRSSRLKMH